MEVGIGQLCEQMIYVFNVHSTFLQIVTTFIKTVIASCEIY